MQTVAEQLVDDLDDVVKESVVDSLGGCITDGSALGHAVAALDNLVSGWESYNSPAFLD